MLVRQNLTSMVATRKPLDTSFNAKRIADITDTGIQKILLNYLKANDNSPEQAFTPEGIAYLNEHIAEYNNGKPHQPILKVRVSEVMGAKFAAGQTGSKKPNLLLQSEPTFISPFMRARTAKGTLKRLPLTYRPKG